MPEIPGRIAPTSQTAPLAVESRLRTEGSIFTKCLRAIIGIEQECEVVVADVAASSIDGFKREASTVREAGVHDPASLLLQSCGAGGCDDLGVNCRASVGDVACIIA